jgi:4,5-dihydroxyphthalate decarboxylase
MTPPQKTYPATGPVSLAANITLYEPTRALMEGHVVSDLVTLEFAGLKNAHAGFKAMLRRNEYDVSEMAVATFLQAHEFGKPFSLLPVVVLGRFQHQCIGYNSEIHPHMTPVDLTGKVVGVRSYTQMTGLWVRGILQNEYGVDPDSVKWLCFDKPHLEEYTDAPSVIWGDPVKDTVNMLLDGEVDAAILGMNMPKDQRVRTLIPNPYEAALDWYEREQLVPPNHYIIVPDALCEQRPDVMREAWRMLVDSRKQASSDADIDAWPVGIEASRKALECAIKYASQQHMIAKPVKVEDLFHPLVREIAP